MRSIFLGAILGATTALLSIHAFANPVKHVLPYGKDGPYYYYQVKCTNGTQAKVVVRDKDKKVCAQAFGRERVCIAGWSVQRAAKHACK